MRKELEAIPKNRLKLFYTLDEPPAGWQQGKGFISEEMCRENLPQPSEDSSSMIFNWYVASPLYPFDVAFLPNPYTTLPPPHPPPAPLAVHHP